jgi:hypothetical protein
LQAAEQLVLILRLLPRPLHRRRLLHDGILLHRPKVIFGYRRDVTGARVVIVEVGLDGRCRRGNRCPA